MRILHNWTRRRIENAAVRFMKGIPEQDSKHILSLLGRIIYSEATPEYCMASTGFLQNGTYVVTFYLPYLWCQSRDSLLLTIAHEFAHVFLEHVLYDGESREPHEEAVHQQLEAWGFTDNNYELVSQFLKEHPEI